MKILFLGDIVGNSGCNAVKDNLPKIIKDKSIDFVIANGENAAREGVGITENITNELLNSGVDVITTGNHVWDQKETYDFISREKRFSQISFWLLQSPLFFAEIKSWPKSLYKFLNILSSSLSIFIIY